tara:strand:+ start:29727 stop:30203 length:477 start_codon:yes stop_codon:yes gene_type:complete
MSENKPAPATIWVDADACPVFIKEILIKAAKRTGIQVTFVANQSIALPPFTNLKSVQVSSGFDVADNWIVQQTQAGDLVITQDIPLADEVITKGAIALGTRGQKYSKENIKSRLNMRDFMETMRSSGIHSGGPAPQNQQDKQNFANQLDRWLAKVKTP